MDETSTPGWQAGRFGATRWTLVLNASRGGDSLEGRLALEELCRPARFVF